MPAYRYIRTFIITSLKINLSQSLRRPAAYVALKDWVIEVLGARGNGVKIRFALSAVWPSKIVNNGSVGVGVRGFDDE